MSDGALEEVVLVRHAETEWTLSGRHTGRTDIPLTQRGRATAAALAPAIGGRSFATVLVSPSRRARETCELMGLAAQAELREDLLEWNYGEYEGLTTEEIASRRPNWDLWRDGCPGGEQPEQVGARADRAIAELRTSPGDVAVFSHGHMLRVLSARWIGLPAHEGSHLVLHPAAFCLLGYERRTPALLSWNEPSLLEPAR